jgi:hypothetical protein
MPALMMKSGSELTTEQFVLPEDAENYVHALPQVFF